MKRLVYGVVAVSALDLGTGGLGVACEQHAKSAALQTPAAATTQATYQGSWVVAQQDGDKSGDDTKEKSEDSK